MLKKIKQLFVKKNKYKIIIVRHGQSEGNVNPSLYMSIPDHKIQLTELGKKQAEEAGRMIKKIVKEEPLDIYYSPYKRTKQTWEGIKKGLDRNNMIEEEDSRLREQQHTMFKSSEHRKAKFKEQKEFSMFYYKFGKGGESVADVLTRISTFLTELRVEKKVFNRQNDCIIVAHEIALKSMILKFYKLSTEDYKDIPSIENCAPIVLETEDFKTAKIVPELTKGNKELISFLERFKN